MITATGIGSGMDIEGIVSQLMEVERAPVRALDSKRNRLDVELSAFGSVKSTLNEVGTAARTLGDPTRFGSFVTESSDEGVFTATAGPSASAESHDIVVSQLASAHRIASSSYASPDSDVDTGTWTLTTGLSGPDTEQFDITIGAGARSLTDLRDAINDSGAGSKVVASILNTDDGARLVLNARDSGAANQISLQPPGGGGGGFTTITPGQDALLTIDGFDVTSASNSVTGAIEGVTLELVGTGAATAESTRDTSSIRENMEAFVEQYNAMRAKLAEAAEGVLRGDRLPREAELRIRSIFSLPVSVGGGETLMPLDVGFTFDRYGALSIDEARLVQAQEAGLDRFVEVFTSADTGFGARINEAIDSFTQAGGLIGNREDGVGQRRASIESQIARQDYRLEQVEARYRRQFSAMDRMVGELQSTGEYLAQRLGTTAQR